MLKLNRYNLPNYNAARKEYHESGFIPYWHHWNEDTIITKNEWLMKVIKLSGYSFETADDEDVDIKKSVRNQLLRGMASGSFALYFHTIRRRQNAFEGEFAGKHMGNLFADYVNFSWNKKHSGRKSFVNELYITIIKKADVKGVAIIEHIFKKFNQVASKSAWESDMRDNCEELDEIINRVTTSFRDYSPKVLGLRRTKYGTFSEILEFISKIVNCGGDSAALVHPGDLSRYIPSNRLYFGPKSVEILAKKGGPRYAGIISLREYGQNTSAGMLDSFLQLPHELVISQSFHFTNRQVAINKMQIQQNRMIQSADKAVSQVVEISAALDDAMSGRINFGEHHLTVMCIADTPKSLENSLSLAQVELENAGVYAIREKWNLEPAFWAQLPANFDFIVRKAVISTLNLAGFASQHNYPVGSKFGNHWGEAVTVFDTTSGTPFFFNFHVRDVGHTTIIGPTGAGKTVLMNFLCAQAMKFKPRLFFFDKDRGAEIFIRALGGLYTVIEPREPTGFNPLQLEDTPENRTFLIEWFRSLVTVHDKSMNNEDIARITEAIEGNYKLKEEDRTLKNVVPFLGLEGPETLAGRIRMWHGEGSHAALFDNEEDLIDFGVSDVFGFEMGKLLRDEAALGPALLYLFHRISISLDGTPTMIVLDEAWALIDNPIFAPKIKDWLKVLRKLNTFVVFATQSVEDASKSAISDTLIQQTATQIFLPNLKATRAYCDTFMLSEREYTLIKHTDPGSRFFLVKQGNDAVVARIDLRGMEDIISILSGRAETVRLLDKIRDEVGDNPADWLPVFYEKVKDVE